VSAPQLPPEITQLIERVLASSGLLGTARAEVERELRAHFEDGLTAGHSPAELAARFGDPGQAGRRIRLARGQTARPGARTRKLGGALHPAALVRETRRALRSLAASPLYASMVVATLALGVGANTAVFTVLDSVLLEPLPYPDGDRLVRVYERSDEDGVSEYLRGLGVLEYRKWDDLFESFGVLYTYREEGGDLTDGDRPERVVASPVDAGFFAVTGASPLIGRTFTSDESLRAGAQDGQRRGDLPRVVVLSEGLWARRFGADPSVVGSQLQLDGTSFEVIGVLPASFEAPFGSTPDLWVPQDLTPGGSNSWVNHYLSGVAKLREGVTLKAAQARAQALSRALQQQFPAAGDQEVFLVPLRQALVGDTRRTTLLVLAGAVGLVLLSACVNVSNLVFARNLWRVRDIAVRSALGAERSRLVVHLLAESLLLALAGAVVGVAVGWLGVRVLLAIAPEALPGLLTPELSVRVFGVGFLATTVALALFGLAPALRFSNAAPADAMRGAGRTGTESRRTRALRGTLVVVQVAAALVLLVGAGLLTRSFAALRRVELGVEPEGVLTFEVNLPDVRYPDGASRDRFHRELGRRIAALPGVAAAGAASWLPLNGRYNTWGFNTDPANPDNDDTFHSVDVRIVSGDYFDAVGIDLLRGQRPESVDPDGPPVVWISRSLAEQAFVDQDPVGGTVHAANGPRTVVGVVEDVRHDLRLDFFPTIYLPHAQYADDRNWALVQAVRGGPDQSVLLERIGDELRSIDPALVLYRPRPFTALLAARRAQDRFATALMSAFAALAVTLSAVGTYGVLAGLVERKRKEIGIRLALGARAAAVRAMILRSALLLAAGGAALGLPAAWVGARSLASVLFEVPPADPGVFASAAALLLGLSALAAWLPARRATRLDPARTLGSE
jgi:predicted permease